MNADWLDNIGTLLHNDALDVEEAQNVLNEDIKKDIDYVASLEKKIKETKESGFWASLRTGTLYAELKTAQSQLAYHKKVLDSLKNLPDNKKERERLISNLTTLRSYQNELVNLKKDYATAKDTKDTIKVGAQIAAKEVQIQALRSLIKGLFLI